MTFRQSAEKSRGGSQVRAHPGVNRICWTVANTGTWAAGSISALSYILSIHVQDAGCITGALQLHHQKPLLTIFCLASPSLTRVCSGEEKRAAHTITLLHPPSYLLLPFRPQPPFVPFILFPSLSSHSPSAPSPGKPCFPICLALSISSHSSKLLAMPVALAMPFRSTRKESYTPIWTGSMGSPEVRSRPAGWPSACSSWSVATEGSKKGQWVGDRDVHVRGDW